MTDGQPHPDEELTPPTKTRWDQGSAEVDEELAPPFVPGKEARAAGTEGTAAPARDEIGPPEEEPFPFEMGPEAGGEAAADVQADDDFPFDAFDIEGDASAGSPTGFEEDATWPGEDAASAVVDVATRLESMARRLREGGPRAVEAELDSPDRLTALLAGLLAGYLADRE